MASPPQNLIDSIIREKEQIARLDEVEASRADSNCKLLMWATTLQSFDNHFILREGEHGTLYVVNRDDGTEASFAVTGYISQYWLPSNRLSVRMSQNVGTVHQRVVISGASSSFHNVQEACTNVYHWMESQGAEGEFLDYDPTLRTGSDSTFMASTPLLTKREKGEEEGGSLDMPDYLKSCTRGVSESAYSYTEDNQVVYMQRVTGSGGVVVSSINPRLFRHCHLVDVEVCFRGIKLKGGKRMFVHHLSSLTLLDRSANMALVKAIRDSQKKSKAETVSNGNPRKRKYEFVVKEDEGIKIIKDLNTAVSLAGTPMDM